jgi:hypothetical protein
MVKLANTLDEHRDLLLNWFRTRGELALGAVEGLNNKARVTTPTSTARSLHSIASESYPNRLGSPTVSCEEASFLLLAR